MSIADNYNRIQENIMNACSKCGRNPDEITVIAVTKFVPVERISPALEMGLCNVGENRANEFRDKLEFFKNNGCLIHFIGQLQTNKVKYIINKAHLIQSVDRIDLAREIDLQAKRLQVVQDILIEVNIGGEEQKGGVNAQELPAFLQQMQSFSQLRIHGLMCVPPIGDAVKARQYFSQMKTLFEKNRKQDGGLMRQLSMGMSSDYMEAIQEGATMVRLGTALFGPR